MLKLMLEGPVLLPLLLGTLLIACPLAMAITLCVTARLRRRIGRMMVKLAASAAEPPLQPIEQLPAKIDMAARERGQSIARHVWRVYFLGGLVFAIASSAVFLCSENACELGPRGVARILLIFLTPLPFALTLTHTRRGSSLAWVGFGWGLLVFVADLQTPGHAVVVLALAFVAAPALLAAFFALNAIRVGGPPLLVTAWFMLVGAQLGAYGGVDAALHDMQAYCLRADLGQLPLAEAVLRCVPPEMALAELQKAHPGEGVLGFRHPERAAAALAKFVGMVLAGSLALLAVSASLAALQARRYKLRRASDVRLSIDLLFQLFAITYGMVLLIVRPGGSGLVAGAGMIFAYLLYRLVCQVGLRAVPAANAPLALTLLRTFGNRRRTQQLLESIARHWRPLGPIRLITGTDSVQATLDLPDFYDFVLGRLQRHFEPLRIAGDHARRDPDGLYRFETACCHANGWQPVVLNSLRGSAAVLMDLRGFTADHRGCVFELAALAQVPHVRSVLLVDHTTDMQELRATLARHDVEPSAVVEASGSMSRTVARVFDELLGAPDAIGHEMRRV